MAYSEYVDLKYRPGKNDLVCSFRLEPAAGVGFRKAAEAVAGESSIGTWTDVKSSRPYVERLAARVFEINEPFIKVAYPRELFELDNVPQILSSVAGNIFGMKIVRNLRLEDINLPDKAIRSFKGPRFGIGGVRKLVGVPLRPLVGTIVKPKLGLRTRDHAGVAYDAWMGGCDIVKDDENLSSQGFNPFKKRVTQTLKARNRAEQATGETKVYMPNVTAETKTMMERARFVRGQGGRYIMVDIMTTGWSALQTLRNADLGLVIHAHRAMHAAVTRNPRHGISMLVVAKLARLIGVDQIHIGTIIGKMEGEKSDVIEIEQQIEKGIIRPHSDTHALGEEWMGMKPVFAVCSGGLHPGHVPKLVKMLGKDIIIQMGGGIHGHPGGTRTGATAARQAVDAAVDGAALDEYLKGHKELALALNKWNK
jgi:ribulose-bisphosphate carboxylase large chain